jgi:hypothetical protein
MFRSMFWILSAKNRCVSAAGSNSNLNIPDRVAPALFFDKKEAQRFRYKVKREQDKRYKEGAKFRLNKTGLMEVWITENIKKTEKNKNG